MEPTEQEAPAQEAEAQEVHAAPHTTPHAAPAPEPKRRGRPPGSKNKPQDVPTEPAAPKRKPKPPVETTPVEAPPPAEAPPAEAPPAEAPVEAPQLTREQQRALRMLERQSAYDRLTTGASVLV